MKWVGIFILMFINLTNGFAGVKAVLFDCDGTLVDSEYAHYGAWKQALNDMGSDLTLDDYYKYIGNSAETNAKLLAKSNGINCPDQLLKTKKEYYRSFCETGLPSIAATVSFLKALALEKTYLGIKIGVCSAARREEILFHLKHLEIDDLIDIVLSGQDDLYEYSDLEGVNKPKPYIYLHAMKLLGVSPKETVVIEDSATGASAGVSAGCFTIAVPNNYTKHHDFSHTNWQLDSFSEMNARDFLDKVESSMKVKQKIIGVIGGVSWESTALYYKLLNQSTKENLGGLNSAKILLYSLNYDPIVRLEREGRWMEVGDELALAAQILEKGGANFIILCCNTLHKMTSSIEEGIQIPFLHIADPAGEVLVENHIQKVGLLGTQFTMEDGFYHKRLAGKFGLEVITPTLEDRKVLDSIIYDELCQGKFLPESKQKIIQIIQRLQEKGARAVLLGCTELGMLIKEKDVDILLFDTTVLHANEAMKRSLQ